MFNFSNPEFLLKVKEENLKRCEEIGQDSQKFMNRYHQLAEIYEKAHSALGIGTTIFSVISTALAFSDYLLTSGIMSIIAAILAFMLTFLNPSSSATKARILFTKFSIIYNQSQDSKIPIQSAQSIKPIISETKKLSEEYKILLGELPNYLH